MVEIETIFAIPDEFVSFGTVQLYENCSAKPQRGISVFHAAHLDTPPTGRYAY